MPRMDKRINSQLLVKIYVHPNHSWMHVYTLGKLADTYQTAYKDTKYGGYGDECKTVYWITGLDNYYLDEWDVDVVEVLSDCEEEDD